MGLIVNPYDLCIANKIVDGHQLTLRWHVDNLMISHVDMLAINDFLWEVKVIYGDSLTESTGKQHSYLGMIVDFSSKNEVQINMNLYISKILKEFPEEIRAPLGARAYPWILSKYFPSVRPSVRPSVHPSVRPCVHACVRPPTDKHRVCILCVKQHFFVVF